MAVMVARVDGLVEVRERLEAFGAEVLAEAMNRPVQRKNGVLYLRGLLEEGPRKSLEPLVDRVYEREDLYEGPHAHLAPDLTVVLRDWRYRTIGLHDFTLYPLLRPGSFVQIDSRVRRVQPLRWRTEFDRPIYFIELRDGYACSWCDLLDDQLLLLPHPLSPVSARKFRFGIDAEIVGQVSAVAMRLTDAGGAPGGNAKLPKRV